MPHTHTRRGIRPYPLLLCPLFKGQTCGDIRVRASVCVPCTPCWDCLWLGSRKKCQLPIWCVSQSFQVLKFVLRVFIEPSLFSNYRALKAFKQLIYVDPLFSRANEVHIRLGLIFKALKQYDLSLKVNILSHFDSHTHNIYPFVFSTFSWPSTILVRVHSPNRKVSFPGFCVS